MVTATQQLDSYLESFSEFEKLAAGHALPWLRKLRRDAFARFCDPEGKIWSLIEKTDDPKIRDLVIREAMHCPSGRLTMHDKTGKEIEHKLPPSVAIIEDPPMKCSGPLWVRGGITIESHDSTRYETRNRVTLCRCGASQNKPFCDGSHASIKFNDGML